MVLKMAPETTHSKEVVERYENRVIVNCSKQTRIWDTARIISHLQLQSVPDESFLQSEIMIALGESLHRRVLSFKQKVVEQEHELRVRNHSKEMLEQRR